MSRLALLLTLLLASPAWAQTETVGEIVSGTVVRGEIAPVGLGTSGTAVVIDVPPGLILWLDADDSATVSVDGSNRCSAWVDKSGAGFGPVAQPTDANKPVLTAGAVNGRGVLRYVGASSQYLEVDSALVTDYPLTVYAVGSSDAASNTPIVWVGDKDSATEYAVVYWGGAAQTLRIFVSATPIALTSTNYTLSQAHQVTARFVSATNRRITLDAAGEGTATDSRAFAGYDRTSVGRYGDSTPSTYHDGDSCEVLVTDRDNTAAVQAQMHAYLQAKWDTP